MKTRVANEPLAELMDRHVADGSPALCIPEGDRIRCVACGHRCLIGDGLRGICKVRFNDRGTLQVPFGYVAALQCDPVEKKPFFHVYPGSDALTFGMLGCDYRCSFCQNWLTSQALRDPAAVAPLRPVTPSGLVELARREGARLVVSSYNEPLITAEWSAAVFDAANAAGLACAFVSNGNATPEVLDFLKPRLVAYKVDLKGFDDRRYRTLGGTLDGVLRTIEGVHARGLWLEVVTLVIPGFNDSDAELRGAARFLAGVSRDIPWHVTAFHKDYRMTDPDPTSAETLLRACAIGAEAGLRYVYAGNLPGRVGPWEDTRCPACARTVIKRFGYLVRSYDLTPDGRCRFCSAPLPGRWHDADGDPQTGDDLAAYQSRLPRRVDTPSPPTPLPLTGERRERSGGSSMSVATPLSADDKARLVAAAAGLTRAAVAGTPAPADGLGDLRDRGVGGAFVSLKRGGHLRACCGVLGATVPLARALEHAAARTAWDDARFPPISPEELAHLEMEVWILQTPRLVEAKGDARADAVEVGKHGVQVVRNGAQGLFLPSVAIDHGWDARRFLDQVCLKAGLPASAWREDDATVLTFEGEAGYSARPFADGPRLPPRGRVCSPADLGRYVDYCRGNLSALLTGATPNYYLFGAPDGNLSGVVLTLQRPDTTEVRPFLQLSLRPGVPLQSTLFSLTQTAAQYFVGQGMRLGTRSDVPMGVTLLHEPILHGTVADPHLEGFDPRRRALLVMERNKTGLVFDPEKSAADLVKDAAQQAQVTRPAAAALYSLDAITSVQPVRVSTVPKPIRGGEVRPAAVAGSFYDADPAALAATVNRLLEGERPAKDVRAALVPHAGLKYSGKLAADVLKRIRIPKHVIVLGPKHTPHGVDWAVAPHRTWELPGGSVESDFVLARQLCQALPGVEMDAAAHQREHAIEVELPLLARLAPETKVVGVAFAGGDLDDAKRLAQGLASLLRERSEMPLLLISSDMNHFATDAETRRLDALALAALDKGDPEELHRVVTAHSISMCGVFPAVVVLETLKLLGKPGQAERVGYATSADVTGDPSRVVGYAGMLFA